MAKKENKYYSLALTEIQEISYNYNIDFDFSTLTEKNLSVGLNHTIKIDEKKQTIGILISIHYRTQQNDNQIVEYTLLVKFQVSDLKDLISVQGDQLEIKDKKLILNLFNITIGTLRGAFFLKVKGTPLEKFPLPLIPAGFLEKTIEAHKNK